MKNISFPRLKKLFAFPRHFIIYLVFFTLFLPTQIIAQTQTTPQVPFLQRTATATPTKAIYNVKGDFTLLGNTNLTLLEYGDNTDNENNIMKYVDIDGDPTTLNSSMATLELSNSGENSADQNCSSVLFAGLYWTGKSDDDLETFSISNILVSHNSTVPDTNYLMTVSRAGSSDDYYPIYTFTGNSHSYAFSFTNNTSGSSIITLKIDGGGATNIPVTYNNGTAIFTTPYTSNPTFGAIFSITSLTRNTSKKRTLAEYQSTSYANITLSSSKYYDKTAISLKGPGDTAYNPFTAKTTTDPLNDLAIRFPGADNSGIFIGYQEITKFVQDHGPGAYTVADIALIEGNNGSASAQRPGYSGGWGMVVIYENPIMNSRSVTLFDGYAYVNGQQYGGGEYGNIDISGFKTVGNGQVNMKLGVMAAEGDVRLGGDYIAVQKLAADPSVYPGNYLILNHANNSETNFFNSSIFPAPTGSNSNPNLVNNTGIDLSMFTIPNLSNSVIGNNQISTTFRFGSTSEVFTIFGFAMSVDSYIPEPNGLTIVNSINGASPTLPLTALPGDVINYSLSITNEGTEATNNTIITIPIPATAIFQTGTITSNLQNGATQVSAPVYNVGANTITWDLGTLPITPGSPELIYANISFTLDVTTDCSIILNAGCNPEVSLETGSIVGTGAISGTSFTKYFFQGYDTSSCHLPIDGSIKVAINGDSCTTGMAGDDQIAACGGDNVTLAANAGTTGVWTIFSGPVGGSFEDSASPTSGFSSVNPGEYTLRWTTTSCTAHFDDVLATISLCNVINYDGIDDNINFKDKFNLNTGNFSIEIWVKPNASNGNTQVILSKHLSPNSTDGYDLRLVNDLISFNWNNNSIVATNAIDANRWYHIAVTFDGTNYNLYIDGIIENNTPGANPVLNNVDFILGAMSQNTDIPYNFYNGYTDELRIWNVSLSAEQIRQMMNQEIINDFSGNVKGVTVPMNINGLSWTSLAGYYQMNRASDISNGYLVDKSGNAKNGKLKSIYVQEPDSAPLPYTSKAAGNWGDTTSTTPWTFGDTVWDYPNAKGIDGTTDIDWNIVETSNDITSGDKDITVLGLISTSGTLTISNPIVTSPIENNSGQSLRVTHYLELDGAIDLVGESQLLQDEGSILDADSGGYLERDQQGTANSFNYNYWTSSVGSISGNTFLRGTGIASTNSPYTIGGVLEDGRTASAPSISYDSSPFSADSGSPGALTISSYWFYQFNGTSSDYNSWFPRINQGSFLEAGAGFTMKGSLGNVPITNKQNYIFKGKPYNGDITLLIIAGNDQLIGNPYPSAMDANKFINDNIKDGGGNNILGNVFNGALYFWDHFGQINTHILREYVGGYSTYTKMGGAKSYSNEELINNKGAKGNKRPGRYIPVNQGFFVSATLDTLSNSIKSPFTIGGGDIVFKNSQRIFITEGSGNSVFMKGVKSKNNTNESKEIADSRPKIWLLFDSPKGYHRQLLVGADENTSNHFDLGYDAPIADVNKEDMFWNFDGGKFVIQGVPNFNSDQELPIGLKISEAGLARIKIDEIENVNEDVSVYIKDNLLGKTYDITKKPFEINLEAGSYIDRFSVIFKMQKLVEEDVIVAISEENQLINEGVQVFMNKNIKELQVKNNTDIEIESISLFNYLGQIIKNWNNNLEELNLSLPINLSTGVYLVQINTKNGKVVKKIIVE